jgi:hypothetical protein
VVLSAISFVGYGDPKVRPRKPFGIRLGFAFKQAQSDAAFRLVQDNSRLSADTLSLIV